MSERKPNIPAEIITIEQPNRDDIKAANALNQLGKDALSKTKHDVDYSFDKEGKDAEAIQAAVNLVSQLRQALEDRKKGK